MTNSRKTPNAALPLRAASSTVPRAPERRRLLHDVLAGAALVAVPGAFARPAAGGRAKAFDAQPAREAVKRAIAQQRLVGAVVLVQHQGRPALHLAAGHADREARTPMREDALFRLASVSKPIVTATAMALVENGTLVLDEPITRWLPAFRPALADGRVPVITLRQLLTHTSGLTYRFAEPAPGGALAAAGVSDGLDESRITLAENLRRLASAPLLFEPGTRWNYSLGIDVVGAAIEAAAGTSLPAAVQRHVSGPLGLHSLGFVAPPGAVLTTPYVNEPARADGSPVPPRRMDAPRTVAFAPGIAGVRFDPARARDPRAFPSGGGGMVGTAGDFMRFAEALRTRALLKPATVDAMARNQTGALGPPDTPGYGFGLGFSVLRDVAAAAAAGSPESAGTWRWGGAWGHAWFVDPSRALSVVAFTNTLFEGMSGPFVSELRDAVYAGL